jgi:hypothetical protein
VRHTRLEDAELELRASAAEQTAGAAGVVELPSSVNKQAG